MTDFKPPAIRAENDHYKIEEIRSYLIQLANQLNFVLSDIEKKLDRLEKTEVKKNG